MSSSSITTGTEVSMQWAETHKKIDMHPRRVWSNSLSPSLWHEEHKQKKMMSVWVRIPKSTLRNITLDIHRGRNFKTVLINIKGVAEALKWTHIFFVGVEIKWIGLEKLADELWVSSIKSIRGSVNSLEIILRWQRACQCKYGPWRVFVSGHRLVKQQKEWVTELARHN